MSERSNVLFLFAALFLALSAVLNSMITIPYPKIDLQKEIPDTIFTQFGKKFIKKGEEIKTKIKEITDVTDYEKLLEAIQDIIIDIVFRNVN